MQVSIARSRGWACVVATAFLAACGGGGGDGTPTEPKAVTPPSVASVTVALGVSQLYPGGTTIASAVTRSGAGAVLTGRSVSWISTSSAVATVDQSGNVVAVGPGTATISATSEGQSGSAAVTVTLAPVAVVSMTLAQTTLTMGASTTASVVLRDDLNNVLTGRTITYTTSAPSVANIDAAGLVTTVGPGTTTLTATSEGRSGVATLIVLPPPVATITVALSESLVEPGASVNATVVLRDAQGGVLTGRTIVWSSSATNVASVNAAGLVTAIAPGTTLISVASEGKTGAATLAVQLPAVATIGVSLSQSVVEPGGTVNAAAVLRDAQGRVLTGRATVWSTSAPNVASVNASGVVTTVAPGTINIIATSEGKTGFATLKVQLPPIANVTVSGSSRVKVGDVYNYSVTARLADGTVVNRPVLWSTSDASRATITQGGVLTVWSEGSFRIQVTIDGELWDTSYTSYDWLSYTSSGTMFATLAADNTITGRLGVAEYPRLVFSCGTSGYFFAWVTFTNFITASGSVAMSFDGGSAFSQTWNELSPEFRTLWKPGSNLTVKTFALQVASSRQFGFAFSEYQGTAEAMIFRVTGLSARLAPIMAACPGNAIVAGAEVGSDAVTDAGLRASMAAAVGAGKGASPAFGVAADGALLSQLLGERALEAGMGPSAGAVGSDAAALAALRVRPTRVVEQQEARKRR